MLRCGWLILLLFFPALFPASGLAAAAPRVVVSVKPLALLVASLTQGEIQPQLLLPPGSSPHDYAFRPSDIHKLKQAELIIWIGEPLERFLAKPLTQLAPSAHIVELIALPGMSLHYHGNDGHEQNNPAGETHHHHDIDPHLWLGPAQMALAATHISAQLSSLQPQRAEYYQQQLQQFLQRLEQTRSDLAARLQPLAGRGYFVFHDAYGYFEEAVGLKARGSFTINPQRRPGARTLSEIRHQLQAHQVRCVFAEPQFRPEVIRSVIEGTDVRISVLDPLGSDIPVDTDGYFHFLQTLGVQMLDCLQD